MDTMAPLGRAGLAREVARRLARRAGRRLARPATWLLAALVAGGLVLFAGQPGGWLSLSHPAQPDYAEQYMQALQHEDADVFLAALSPQSRAGFVAAAQQVAGARPDSVHRAAEWFVHTAHVDRYTLVGRHATETGAFVVYAVERTGPDGEHTSPLILWLDRDGRVVRSLP